MNRLDEIVNVFVHSQKAGWTDYYYARDGRMEKAVTHTGNTETYTYNGRSITTKRNGKTYTKTLDSWDYVYSNIYDNWGRLTRHIAPNGYMLQYTYDNTDSHLTRVADGNNKTLWTYIRNIPGRESSCRLGNQLRNEVLSSENEEESILRWTRPNGTALLEMNYSLDPILGNVTSRTEKYAGRSFTENFKYDEMDRLTRISGSSSMLMVYEPNGNITFKQDIGFYRYNDSRRTHALTSIEEPAAQLKKLATQIVTYTEFNKVKSVQEKGYKMVFWYGADEQRIKSELYRNTLRIRTIYYGDGFERHIDANGNSKEYTYLDSDGGYFGMVITENETSSTYYFHTDLLGSLVAISDDNGIIVERRSYDAWGRRRNPNDWTDYNSNRTLELTLIGYTFQEEMPEFNLINLNGRLYDPLLGRMLSPDPFIQDPENSQNYNRYSYAWNNPMKYSDPNGNFIHLIIGAIIGGAANVLFNFKNIDNFWQGLSYFGIGAAAGAMGAGIGAGVSSAIAGGSFGAGFIGSSVAMTATSSFISGAAIGGSGGLASGFLSGFGNGLLGGKSFGQALWSGTKDGLIGGLSGAAIGGLWSGLDAAFKGRRFWDGATIQRTILAEQNIPITGQIGDNNCLPASAEAVDKSFGGNMTQENIRNLTATGSDPMKDALIDKDVWSAYKRASGHPFIQEYGCETSPSLILRSMESGNRVAINLNLNTGDVGHSVVMQKIVQKTAIKVNGKITEKLLYYVMNPANGGRISRISSGSIINAKNIFHIFPLK